MSENVNHTAFNRNAIIRGAITLGVLVALYVLIRRLSGVLLPFLISLGKEETLRRVRTALGKLA